MGGKEEEGAWDGYSLRMLVVVVVLAIAGRLSGEDKPMESAAGGTFCPPGIPVMSYYLVDVLAASSSGEAVGEGAAAVLCGVTELVGGLVSLVLTDVVGRWGDFITPTSPHLTFHQEAAASSLLHHDVPGHARPRPPAPPRPPPALHRPAHHQPLLPRLLHG